MMDFGAVSTALGTLFGSIMTGLVMWKTMQKEGQKSDSAHALSMDQFHFQEERDWRTELNAENEKLRERAEKKILAIEKLLEERHILLQAATDQSIKIKELEHLVKNLRHIIEQYKGLVNDSTTSSKSSASKASPENSNDGDRNTVQQPDRSTGK